MDRQIERWIDRWIDRQISIKVDGKDWLIGWGARGSGAVGR